ncbi:MAG: PLP-dependent aspartate aminotransferase family protein [Clostridia bacterium]|nr:cystathionine gamma-synthase [Bacillota bacterium]
MDFETRAARAGVGWDSAYRSVATPIYQTAIFEHQKPLVPGADPYSYTRLGNPTRAALEHTLADLEGGGHAFAFSSGMAAIYATLQTLRPGSHIIATAGLYGHTFAVIQDILAPLGIRAAYVDTSSVEAVLSAWTEKTAAVYVEMPSNPLLRAADLPALASICKERKARLIVDSTFLTPWGIRPLELGADIVVHSATKYLAGHNDTLAGAVIVRSPSLAEELAVLQRLTGSVLSPFDSFLTLRGIKTLAVRMERAQANAMALAEWLRGHPLVEEVHYPGLAHHPDRPLFEKQARGFGSVLSFAVKSPGAALRVLERTRLILVAESLGGVESLITYPWTQTHQNIPPAERARLGIHDRLLRLSVGIESAADLIDDLAQALEGAGA